ncbi:MAG TPA: hypothetical protein VF545_04760 [Thermoleophilaceae bacterium]
MSAAPQLVYALSTDPVPLQASPEQGNLGECQLMLVASNPAPDPNANPVVLEGVEITVPIGDGPAELMPDATGVGPVPPAGWGFQPNTAPGVYAFVPDGDPGTKASVGAEPLVFALEAVPVNRSPGPVLGLQVLEGTAGSPTLDLPLTKFPNGWGTVQFWALPANIAFGGSTTLHWSGPPGATYQIEYATAAGVVTVPPSAGPAFSNMGIYPAVDGPPLAPAQTTVFTLDVTDTIDDVTYSTQEQKTVTVVPPGPDITQFAGVVEETGDGTYQAVLDWKAEHTDYCTLSAVPAQELQPQSPSNGYPLPVTAPFAGSYVLNAVTETDSTSATVSLAWGPKSVTPVPAACQPPTDIALSPDGSLLYLAGGDSCAVYQTPAVPLPAPMVSQMPWPSGTAVRLAGASSSPQQLAWSMTPSASSSGLGLIAGAQGGASHVSPNIVMYAATGGIAASQGGSFLYGASAPMLWRYTSDVMGVAIFSGAAANPAVAIAASADERLYLATATAVTGYVVVELGSAFILAPFEAPLPLAGVTGLAVSGEFLFVAAGQQVVVVDRNSMQQAGAPIAVAADRIAVSPDGLRLYALHIESNAITVVSPTPLIPS